MQIVNFSELRRNLKRVMDSCCYDHDIAIITRTQESHLVMMSLGDYNAWQETFYLVKNPKNNQVLIDSIHQARQGNVVRHDLVESDA